LAQHGVDESGLAVVDVGDDGDVTDGLRCGAHWREILSYEMAIDSGALRGVQMRVGAKKTQLTNFTADGVVLAGAVCPVSETADKISVPPRASLG
jgi:hypothetical protein